MIHLKYLHKVILKLYSYLCRQWCLSIVFFIPAQLQINKAKLSSWNPAKVILKISSKHTDIKKNFTELNTSFIQQVRPVEKMKWFQDLWDISSFWWKGILHQQEYNQVNPYCKLRKAQTFWQLNLSRFWWNLRQRYETWSKESVQQ